MTSEQIVTTILETPELKKLMWPDGVAIFGIFAGGSRSLNLDTKTSDCELNIIVSADDYYELSKIPFWFHPRIIINNTFVHWYYIPVDAINYNFSLYYALLYYLVLILKGFSKDNFIRIFNREKVEEFVLHLNGLKSQLIEQFYNKHSNFKKYTYYKKTYLFLLLNSIIKNTVDTDIDIIKSIKQKLSTIRIDATEQEKDVLSEDEKQFVESSYNELLQNLKDA